MKTLELKTIQFNGKDLKYSEWIKACVTFPGINGQGYNLEEGRKRMRILTVLEKSVDKLELEDNDADLLKTLVEAMLWVTATQEIIEFGDAVRDMK